jgi:phage gp37-like protein
MSRLGDLENALVSRLAAATLSGSPLFQTVRGVSGGYRPAVRDALRRERMPAAYVAFVDEPTAPEVKPGVRGGRFVVLVAERALRVESDPRHGDTSSLGTFTLLEQTRQELDDYEPITDLRLLNLHQKFVEADDRVAVYELMYRVWPVVEDGLLFAGVAVAGNDSRMSLEVGPLELEEVAFRFPGLTGEYRQMMGLQARSIVWTGRIRGSDDAAVNAIEANIEAMVLSQAVGVITADSSRTFSGCVLDRYVPHGPRRLDIDGQMVCQDAELCFLQLNPGPVE